MNSFRNRLDALATSATTGLPLDDPARRAPARRVRRVMPGIPIAAVLVLVAALAWWQLSGDDASELVVGDEGRPVAEQPDDDGQPVAGPPIAEPCAFGVTLELLRSGLPTYDYEPAGSYADLASLFPDAVSGRVVSAARMTVNGTSYTELTIADVVDVGGHARPDVDVIAYQAAWNDRSSPDPLAQPVAFDDVYFFALLTPWSGVRGGWNPGVEGLYITCGAAGRLSAVIADGRGDTDPQSPTIQELAAVLGGGLTGVATPDPTGEAAQAAEAEAAAQQEREAEAIVDPAGLMAIRDALVQFGRGEALAIEEIPLADQVSLGLGSEIHRTESKDTLRDPAVWQIGEPAGYAGFTGPFSVLATLASAPETQIVVGEHPNCAGPALPAPAGFERHLQVSIQPADATIDSCLRWFSIDLFFELDTMAIAAVTLSLFGP